MNGRLDDPGAWLSGIDDDLYQELDRVYSQCDTILVGRTTYQEMYEYWPGAMADENESDTARSMARKMDSYKKYVFSGAAEQEALEWNNAELVPAHGDSDLERFVRELKAQSGGDIHLTGGARLARTIIRLGLVDEYHFFVHPTVSKGATWFDEIEDQRDLELLSATAYPGGVVGLYYTPKAG